MPTAKRSTKSRFKSLADKIFRTGYLIAAIIIFICMSYVRGQVVSDARLDLSARTLRCENPLEVARMSDGSTVINDASLRIFCIAPDGSLRYHIDAGRNEQLTGITVDGEGNLYCYRSEDNDSLTLRDRICMYAPDGTFLKTLYTIDYTNAAGETELTVRTSPLHVEDGVLFFTRYLTYETQLCQIDLASGAMRVNETLTEETPYLYNDVEGHPNGVYYYAKITGELGVGRLGGGQTVLYQGSYNIADNSGLRPFYIREVGGAVYTYDYWAGKIYQVKDGALRSPSWGGDVAYNVGVYELSSANNSVQGISGGVPWAVTDGKAAALRASATLPIFMVISEALLRALRVCAVPVMAAALCYILLCLAWLILVRGRHIAWKLLVYEFLITAGLIALVYLAVSSRYQVFVNQNMTFLSERAELTAALLSNQDVSEIKGSADLNSDPYAAVSRMLIERYGVYESETDTAAAILVPGGEDGRYCVIASNRGYGDILGTSSLFSELIERSGDTEGSEYSGEKETAFAFSAVYTPQRQIAGYLCLYTTTKNIRSQFHAMWSPLTLLGYFALLCLLFVVSTALISRKLRRVTGGIQQIASGDFTLRIPESAEDELGTLIHCVNDLSQNIEDLVQEKVELVEEVRRSQYEVLISLASIVENKSGQTAAHVKRVSECVRVLAAQMGYKGQELEYLSIASTLHDVGKLFVPSEILDKPGKLTPAEFDVVKRHTRDGEQLLHNVPGTIMRCARIIALEHHEKWDGTGYPLGRKGEEIHMEARITALADVFDALMSERSYKKAFTAEETYRIIVGESGAHFDPQVVAAFQVCFRKLCQIVAANPDLAA